ncbi:AAA family ATPase [Nocardioides ultimimeridianus]
MRPVRLDLDGFASFREPASVDFTDVDYFSLVGPTGSGKSTIIDAITFALYGTAHRWERANAISYALAPTTNRCTVSLIFDVSGRRYQVVREVRRVGQTIQQKAARLERFLDPAACPVPGDAPAETEVLVSEVRDLTPAVAELLGMEFDDFCQCVVLPQGEFGRFLKATPRDRQTILLKLLGGGHYEHIGRIAGARAKEADKEVEMYADQLRELAEVTPAALAEATTRRDSLVVLDETISDLVAPVLTARTEEAKHREAAQQAADAAEALIRLRAPEGLADRQAVLTRATGAYSAAAEAAAASAAAYVDATKVFEAGPQRSRLEAAAEVHSQVEQVRASLVTAHQDAEQSTKAAATATAAAQRGTELAQQARIAAQEARAARDEAATKLADIQDRLRRVRAVVVPADLDDVAEAAGEAAAQLAAAEEALHEAKKASADASAACFGLPDPRVLSALDTDIAVLVSDSYGWDSEEATVEQLRSEVARSDAMLSNATALLDAAWAQLDASRSLHAAAALRPTLAVGHECPVCTQTVTTLPPTSDGPDVEALTSTWERAKTAHRTAEEQHREAVRALESFAARHDALGGSIRSAVARIVTTLADLESDDQSVPNPAPLTGDGLSAAAAERFAASATETVSAVRERAVAAFTRRDQTAEAMENSEKALAAARGRVSEVRERSDAHRSALVRAHTGVEADGAPDVDTTSADSSAGWGALSTWAGRTAEELEADLLPAATSVAQETEAEADRRGTLSEQAEATATSLSATATQVAAAASAAAARQEQLSAQEADLTARIRDLPGPDELPPLFAEADRLAEARNTAACIADEARAQASAAAQELQSAQAAVTADRDALSAARDALAAWGPPVFPADRLTTDLGGCFAELVAWAAARSVEHTKAAAAAQQARRIAADDATGHLASLVETLTENGLPADEVEADPRAAERVVAVAYTQAAATTQQLGEALARKSDVVTKAEDARERSVVAGELRTLLRSDKFQQWLATAALDTLVAGASERLFQLSDGQFTLTHDKGEFYVIDHLDADSQRSVRTLSGGETFQASLALALALSEQLASLAVGGTARLDSIFLDEGFGTLDPDALETVAATLENLAQGERMVGVVTHVAALAERTPTRFLVSHDNRTSRVEKESA